MSKEETKLWKLINELQEVSKQLDEQVKELTNEIADMRLNRLVEEGEWL